MLLLLSKISSEVDYEKLNGFISEVDNSEFYKYQDKITKLITPILKNLKELTYSYHHANLYQTMKSIHSKLNNSKGSSCIKCPQLVSLLKVYEGCLGMKLKTNSEEENYSDKKEQFEPKESWIKDYLEEEHETMVKTERKYPAMDVNKLI